MTCILNNESNMLGDNVQSLFRYFYQGNSTTDIGTNINIVQGDHSFVFEELEENSSVALLCSACVLKFIDKLFLASNL